MIPFLFESTTPGIAQKKIQPCSFFQNFLNDKLSPSSFMKIFGTYIFGLNYFQRYQFCESSLKVQNFNFSSSLKTVPTKQGQPMECSGTYRSRISVDLPTNIRCLLKLIACNVKLLFPYNSTLLPLSQTSFEHIWHLHATPCILCIFGLEKIFFWKSTFEAFFWQIDPVCLKVEISLWRSWRGTQKHCQDIRPQVCIQRWACTKKKRQLGTH